MLLALGTVIGTVGDDRTKVVKCSARASLDGFLILIFSFLLATISCPKSAIKIMTRRFANKLHIND